MRPLSPLSRPAKPEKSKPAIFRDLMVATIGAVLALAVQSTIAIITNDYQARLKRDELIINRKSSIYDIIRPHLNDMYVYVRQVGHYKDMTPVNMIEKKRLVDSTVFSNAPYLSASFFVSYNEFMNAIYCTYGKVGQDARIRSAPDFYRESADVAGKPWDAKWSERFEFEHSNPNPKWEIHATLDRKFYTLMSSLAVEITSIRVNTITDPTAFIHPPAICGVRTLGASQR